MFGINKSVPTDQKTEFRRYIEFDRDCFDVTNSLLLAVLPKLKTAGFYTVTNDENRPDMISHAIYDDVKYWWPLMHFNGIYEYHNIPSLTQIRYFSLDEFNDMVQSIEAVKLPYIDKWW